MNNEEIIKTLRRFGKTFQVHAYFDYIHNAKNKYAWVNGKYKLRKNVK